MTSSHKGMRWSHPWLAIVSLALLPLQGAAQTGTLEMSPISGDPRQPRRHFRVVGPADVSPAKAEEVYSIVRDALAAGYARSRRSAAERYQTWQRLNSAPYRSTRHGNFYLNNYVNDVGAEAYSRYEAAGKLPVGTVIAKDSFSLTRSGEVVLGALVVMEKMRPGFNPVSGDWKYSLIKVDGSFFGETNGEGAARVKYCIDCHLVAERHDHLYFIPEEYRAAKDR